MQNRPTQPPKRPAQPSRGQSARRPMTRQQYEAMRRRQRRQNLIGIGIIAAIAILIAVAVILILKPRAPKDVTVVASTGQTGQQTATQTGGEGSADAVPAATSTVVDLATLISQADGDSGGSTATGPAATTVPAAAVAPSEVVRTGPADGSLRSVHMRVIGDIMMCQSQLEFARDSGYDFHNQFELITDVLKNADYTMGNMEGTIGKYRDMAYSGYPMFNAPDVLLQTLRDNGIDFLTLANNHMLDRYFDGMKNTVNWVEYYNIDHVGAYRTKEERNTPVIYEVGGIKFGFVAYTHATNTMENVSDPEGVSFGVPYLNKADFAADIQKLRSAGAEVVIAFPHWGKEYVRTPDENQQKFAKRLAEAGADIIIGSHSHMVQPMGYQSITASDGTVKRVFTVFSMGNFISDHVVQYTDCGMVLDFTVNENADGTFTCDSVGYIPTFTWQQNGAIRVLPIGRYLDSRPEGMNDECYARMKESYNEIIEVVGSDFTLLNS